jgi:hypothetical protein
MMFMSCAAAISSSAASAVGWEEVGACMGLRALGLPGRFSDRAGVDSKGPRMMLQLCAMAVKFLAVRSRNKVQDLGELPPLLDLVTLSLESAPFP